MCYGSGCKWEKWSVVAEDSVCVRPRHLPCPELEEESRAEEMEGVDNEWEPEEEAEEEESDNEQN